MFDTVSWSDIAAAHNRLVVGSSPTSSTTQSPATGESGLVQNAPFFIGAREGAAHLPVGQKRAKGHPQRQHLTQRVANIFSVDVKNPAQPTAVAGSIVDCPLAA